MEPETVVSVDIETDGRIPGLHSMRSLGAVAYGPEGESLDTWYRVFEPLPQATTCPETMSWWKDQDPAAREECFQNPEAVPADQATREFAAWLRALRNPKMLAAPVAFDMFFIKWYLESFVGADRIWHNAIDLRSVAMPIINGMRYNGQFRFGADIKEKLKSLELGAHAHHALYDAIEQGAIFWGLVAVWEREGYAKTSRGD